jgi:hypothetical protein
MPLQEAQSRVKASIWKAIAQSKLDLSGIPQEDLELLVELATDAALVEIDDEIGQTLVADKAPVAKSFLQSDDEQLLWQGRPFLSISREYIITSERIRLVEGLLGKDREDVELIRVQDIDQKQTLSDRLLNLGDITIRSHDSSHPEVVMNNVRDPEIVHEILRTAVLDARRRHGLIYREEM